MKLGECVSALSAGAYPATLYVMVNIVKGGGRAPPTLTSLGKFFHHDGLYARKRPLQLCLNSMIQTSILFDKNWFSRFKSERSILSEFELIEKGRDAIRKVQVAKSRQFCWGGGGLTRVDGVGIKSERGRAYNPTLSNLGRKYHHNGTYARKWPSPVYVLSSPWSCHLFEVLDSYTIPCFALAARKI